MKRYGQEQPPLIPLENIVDFPVALLVGCEDKLAHVNDVRWLKDLLHEQGSVAYYEEYKLGHMAFLLPKNLKHFQDIVSLVKTFNTLSTCQQPSKLCLMNSKQTLVWSR